MIGIAIMLICPALKPKTDVAIISSMPLIPRPARSMTMSINVFVLSFKPVGNGKYSSSIPDLFREYRKAPSDTFNIIAVTMDG